MAWWASLECLHVITAPGTLFYGTAAKAVLPCLCRFSGGGSGWSGSTGQGRIFGSGVPFWMVPRSYKRLPLGAAQEGTEGELKGALWKSISCGIALEAPMCD